MRGDLSTYFAKLSSDSIGRSCGLELLPLGESNTIGLCDVDFRPSLAQSKIVASTMSEVALSVMQPVVPLVVGMQGALKRDEAFPASFQRSNRSNKYWNLCVLVER